VPAEPEKTLETFASELPYSYLQCRELGHNWQPHTVGFDNDSQSYVRVLRCPRCHTERKQLLNIHAHVISNTYTYPKRYQAKGVEVARGGGRDVFRLESIVRYLEKPATKRKAS